MTPARTLLEAVRVLHREGYESLRAHAYRYATGHWRCELGVVGSPVRNGRTLFQYSSAGAWDYFRDGGESPVTPDALARTILARRDLSEAQAPSTAYAVWYSALLDYAGPHGVFVLSDDTGYDAARAGFVEVLAPLGISTTDAPLGPRFPLAPLF